MLEILFILAVQATMTRDTREQLTKVNIFVIVFFNLSIFLPLRPTYASHRHDNLHKWAE